MAIGGTSESLIIDVSVNDQGAARGFQSVRKEATEAGRQAESAFERANRSAAKLGIGADAVASKFRSLGKAAVGIFAADVAAKLLGFRSAIDAIRKASDAAAEGIRSLFTTAASRNAQAAAENIEELREQIEKLRAVVRPSASLSVRGRDFSIGIPAGLSPENQVRAYLQVLEAQKRIVELEKSIADPKKRPFSIFGGSAALTGVGAGRLNQVRTGADPLLQEVSKLEDFIHGLATAQDDAAAATKRHAREAAALTKAYAEMPRSMPFLLSGIPAMLSQFPRMREGFQIRDVRTNERWNQVASGSMQRFGLGLGQFTAGMLDQRQRHSEAMSRGAFATDERWNRMSEESLKSLSVGLASLSVELTKAALAKQKFDATFGGGATDALATLAKDFERNLGSQAVQQTFDSFTGFFFDLATNMENADEALKNLGRNLLGVLASQAAQRLALGATNSLFGLFGIAPQAKGGVWRGGINSFASGGVAYGPQLAMIGDNKSQTEAIVPMPDGRSIPVEMRGGGTVINMGGINVSAIDGPGAASAVARMYPEIEARIIAAISGGRRGLQMAVRGA